jgi:hypothetical protein
MTTPLTPPSRTIRFEPTPTGINRNITRQLRQKISEVVFIGRRKQNLRRAADTKPRERRERLIGEQSPAQVGHRGFQIGADIGKASRVYPSAFSSPGSA